MNGSEIQGAYYFSKQGPKHGWPLFAALSTNQMGLLPTKHIDANHRHNTSWKLHVPSGDISRWGSGAAGSWQRGTPAPLSRATCISLSMNQPLIMDYDKPAPKDPTWSDHVWNQPSISMSNMVKYQSRGVLCRTFQYVAEQATLGKKAHPTHDENGPTKNNHTVAMTPI